MNHFKVLSVQTMRKCQFLFAAGVMMLAAVGCCQKGPKVTAVVAGENNAPVAVVVEYAKAVKADAVTPATFVLPGTEVAFAFVSDKNPAEPKECCKGEKPEKPECCEGKPEKCENCEEKAECCEGKPECTPEKPACCEGKPEKPECCPEGKPKGCPPGPACCAKDGKYVVIVLKGAMPPMMPPMCHEMGKPVPPCPDSLKPECKPGEKPECCKEGKPCEKPEGAPEMKPGEKPEGMPVPPKGPKGKKFGKRGPKVPVNANITIQQVQDIEYVDGGAAKAWEEAVQVKNFAVAAPCCHKGPKGPHPHGHPGAPAPDAPKPAEN